MTKDIFQARNCLILDLDEESLPKNSKVHYLGYWCLENLSNSFKNLEKFNIINSKARDVVYINQDIKEVHKIYNSLVSDLSNFLNKIHNKNYSENYWETIVGPWLKLFLTVVRERYNSLNFAIKKFNISEVMLANFKEENFFVYNVDDFEEKASKNKDGWNSILYSKILKILNYNCKFIEFKIKKKNTINNSKKKNIASNLKKKFISFLTIFNLLSKNSKYVIYASGLKLHAVIKLQLYLKQFPSIFIKKEYPKKKINFENRKKIESFFEKTEAEEYEKLVRSLISSLLPTDFLENYKTLEYISTNLKWPKDPKVIFTSTGYHSDEIFKMYAAKKMEKGSKYIVSQHGANNFTHKNSFIELGYDRSDTFFSWGNFKKDKCVSLFNLKNIALDNMEKTPKGEKLFFFMPKMSKSRKRLYDDYGQMIRDNISIEKILNNLDNKIKESCILKLYPNENDSKELENKILNEIIFKKHQYIIDRTSSKKKIFKTSKLILNYSDGTSFLETISTDIPTIIFLPNLNWIDESVKQDYEKLLENNILFNNEKLMSKHINNIFYDIDSWWNNPKIKKVKLNFEQKYSQRPPNDALKILSKKIFKEI
jgi:putative transferase (TIGR04331 family)